jgi:hypothetical protein
MLLRALLVVYACYYVFLEFYPSNAAFFHRIPIWVDVNNQTSTTTSTPIFSLDNLVSVVQPLKAHVDLPQLTQSTNRILVVITLAYLGDAERQHFLALQLDYYLALCESGYEVHIVFSTVESEASFASKNKFFFEHQNRYFCFRLQRRLPMAVWTWRQKDSNKLASSHRRLFSRLVNQYDFFISQEDDTILRPTCFAYFRKYALGIFNNSEFYPGFAVAELPTPTRKAHLWMTFWGGNQDMDIIRYKGTDLMLLLKPWAPLYILTQSMLQKAIAQPLWTLDEVGTRFGERNVHFQHMWLTSVYKVVIPVPAITNAFLHHSPNKYSALSIPRFASGEYKDKSRDIIVVDELLAFLGACTGEALPRLRFNHESIRFGGSPGHPCRTCTDKGKFASISVGFRSNISQAIAFESTTVRARVRCTSTTRTQVTERGFDVKNFDFRYRLKSRV